MEVSEYAGLDALGLADLIRRRQVSRSEAARAAFTAAALVNPQINAVIETWSDEEVIARDDACFSGVPFLIKDIGIAMAGRRSEVGSRLASGYVSPVDSDLMKQFREAGFLTIGRTTTPEFAISTTTESVANGPTRNPWDPSRSAGGSSGGAGAAVAAGITPIAHGTDASGSIRIPASVNGLVGLKPTRGRVSNGPFVDEIWNGLGVQFGVTRTVRDSAALLDAIAGDVPGEPYYTAPPQDPYLSQVRRDPGSISIGLQLQPHNGARIASTVAEAISTVARHCEALGHRVTEITPEIGLSWEAFVHANTVFCATGTASWAAMIASASGRAMNGETMEEATLATCAFGRNLSAIDYLRALDARNAVTRSLAACFSDFDVLLTPTLPDLSPILGTYDSGAEQLDGLGWISTVFDRAPFTPIANMAGVPAISLPLSFDRDTGLPIGSQFTAGFGREDLLFQLAGQLERALPWDHRRPSIWAGKPD